MEALTTIAMSAALSALATLTGRAHRNTYVYVSNAEDGDIGTYRLATDGTLTPGARVQAGKLVMPMTVSPDKRYLFASIRTQPYSAVSYAIDQNTGALRQLSQARLPENVVYLSTDKTGRFLFGASYGGNLVTIGRIGEDGTISEPLEVVHTASKPHSIVIDGTNRFVFVQHLGSDQILQFCFDAKTGKLIPNAPPVVPMKTGTGPRHLIFSADNKFAYLLCELTATLTALALDQDTGLLTPACAVKALPPDSKLVAGAPRLQTGHGKATRDVANDIWAADLHLTPNGTFLYATERTDSTITAFRADRATGELTYLSTTPTERQPRGFAIDPWGKFMVVAGELSDTISVYAIRENGSLSLLQKYPTGRGSNWVEIVSFD
jgi:6-phosphogluconolactonase